MNAQSIDERWRCPATTLTIDQRTAARARKDYAAADVIRDELSASGIVVEDTPDGPRWTLKANDSQGHD